MPRNVPPVMRDLWGTARLHLSRSGATPAAALLLALALALLDLSYFTSSLSWFLGSEAIWIDWVELLGYLIADAFVVLGLLAVLAVWRPSRWWLVPLLAYLLFRAADRAAVARCDMHLSALAKYVPLLWQDPQSLQWCGGTATFMPAVQNSGLYMLMLTALALGLTRLRRPRVPAAAVLLAVAVLLAFPRLTRRHVMQCVSPHLHALTMGHAAARLAPGLRQEQAALRAALAKARQATAAAQLPACKTLPNVLIVVGESWHAPTVRKLASAIGPELKGGYESPRHFSGANGSTLGLFSILSGRDALFMESDSDARKPILLPNALKQLGYQTRYLGSSNFWIADGQLVMLANCHFDEVEMGRAAGGYPNFERDAQLFDRAASWMNKTDGPPQCVVVFTGGTHYPYGCPKEWWSEPNDAYAFTDRVGMAKRYRNAVRYTLDRIGKMLRSLDLTRTVVVLVGDHGESMGEDGTLSHLSRASLAQCQTPFWLLGPRVPRDAGPTRHVDLAPTILHAVTGQPVPCTGIQGRDLFLGDRPPVAPLCTPFTSLGAPQRFVLFGPDSALGLSCPSPGSAAVELDGLFSATHGGLDSIDVPDTWLPALRDLEADWTR